MITPSSMTLSKSLSIFGSFGFIFILNSVLKVSGVVLHSYETKIKSFTFACNTNIQNSKRIIREVSEITNDFRLPQPNGFGQTSKTLF